MPKVSPDQLAGWLTDARKLGADAALAAASWTVDGNTSTEHVSRVVSMLDDGDPEAYDYLPNRPDLSGEWSDDPTPQSLAREITGDDDFPSDDDESVVVDQLAEAFEDGVSETFETACESELRKALP